MKKIKVGIIFGGKSAEHEVSLQSAKNVFDAIDREKYEPVLIGIDKTGRWLLGASDHYLLNVDDPGQISLNIVRNPITFAPESNGEICSVEGQLDNGAIDVAFPILHGPMGEDGTVQGFLRLANVPFVGAGVLGSAIGMDKDVMKRLLRDAGIPIGKFLVLTDGERIPRFSEVASVLGAPFFVKPANMGSSVGVSKVHDEASYLAAVELAFSFDVKILLEEFIDGREIECAVLGNRDPLASVIGEIKPSHDFYSYDAKYLDEKGAVLEIPAVLPAGVAEQAQDLAIRTFKALSAEGLGRIDMFLKANGEILVNEINTIPGFTKISMYPKLWEASGISYPELIDKLIILAIERFEKEKRLKTSFL
ncbi:D-alanine--D-alanine ligase [Methylobacillus methanolivorans]|uniref:D-alanine--D-alanine ligase n=1 Tax=Methylobacillus methanolivorans TaxID=1848927 RepID=A0ABW8GN79_9PROT